MDDTDMVECSLLCPRVGHHLLEQIQGESSTVLLSCTSRCPGTHSVPALLPTPASYASAETHTSHHQRPSLGTPDWPGSLLF